MDPEPPLEIASPTRVLENTILVSTLGIPQLGARSPSTRLEDEAATPTASRFAGRTVVVEVSIRQIKGASPLRYPGGKSALTGFISQIINNLELHAPLYVEPYAGGAGAALALLDSGTVGSVVINDLDPAIFSFWDAVVNYNEKFLATFDSTPVTLDEWNKQKEIYRAKDVSNVVELGFATYFLNRTNRSGVLNAGVIGGKSQSGTYKIDARFSKKALRPRIEWIGARHRSIQVTNDDGLECLEHHLGRPDTFIYADPPYFDKGSYLYLNAFTESDHVELARLLNGHPEAVWLLSYDNAEEIRSLYKERYQQTFTLNYSAHRNGKARELLVASGPVVNAFDYSQRSLLGL